MAANRHPEETKSDDEGAASSDRPILDAAHALFLEFGLRRTTMDDIARRAGVGRVTVYRHFADKNALFSAVVMRDCARALRSVEDQLEPFTDIDELVVEWFTRMVFTAREHPLRKRLIASDPEWFVFHLTLDAQPILELGILYMASLVTKVQARGIATDVDPRLLGELVLRLLHSIHLTSGGLLSPTTEEESRAMARRYLLPLVHASASSRAT